MKKGCLRKEKKKRERKRAYLYQKVKKRTLCPTLAALSHSTLVNPTSLIHKQHDLQSKGLFLFLRWLRLNWARLYHRVRPNESCCYQIEPTLTLSLATSRQLRQQQHMRQKKQNSGTWTMSIIGQWTGSISKGVHFHLVKNINWKKTKKIKI